MRDDIIFFFFFFEFIAISDVCVKLCASYYGIISCRAMEKKKKIDECPSNWEPIKLNSNELKAKKKIHRIHSSGDIFIILLTFHSTLCGCSSHHSIEFHSILDDRRINFWHYVWQTIDFHSSKFNDFLLNANEEAIHMFVPYRILLQIHSHPLTDINWFLFFFFFIVSFRLSTFDETAKVLNDTKHNSLEIENH